MHTKWMQGSLQEVKNRRRKGRYDLTSFFKLNNSSVLDYHCTVKHTNHTPKQFGFEFLLCFDFEQLFILNVGAAHITHSLAQISAKMTYGMFSQVASVFCSLVVSYIRQHIWICILRFMSFNNRLQSTLSNQSNNLNYSILMSKSHS